ncbi:hypothetical protein LCGC14_1176320 [marine sediment metagenome]|uniref:DUF1360 domain-containing protein n=1 Tax=marine sediment metagenome TaxID=412755 RepID=A0A0F9MBB6_9ZZZZ
MTSVGEVIIIGLAAWRLASLLVFEDGPFAVFARLRQRVGLDDEGEIGRVAELLSCIWCTGFWMAVIMAGLWVVVPWVVMVFAAAAVVLAAERGIRVGGA